MTGWNMPPGCSPRDIPGNSAADQAEEALYDAIYEAMDALDDTAARDSAVMKVYELCCAQWAEGYAQGLADEAQAKEALDDPR